MADVRRDALALIRAVDDDDKAEIDAVAGNMTCARCTSIVLAQLLLARLDYHHEDPDEMTAALQQQI
jgi:hypothetical protein